MFTPTLRQAGFAVVAVLCLIVVLAVAVAMGARKDARAARDDRQMSEGRTTSAVEAITTIGELGRRADATDAQIEEAQNAVRQAHPDDRDRVYRLNVCRLQQRTDCDRLFGAGAVGADHADAAR